MDLLDYFHLNPMYKKYYLYGLGRPNGGFYKSWVQGSPGGQEPLPLWSNEYTFNYMKHGHNNHLPYRGNIHLFSPSVTPEVRRQVQQCSYDTMNPGGCQMAAAKKVFGADSKIPNPFGLSYNTGHSPFMWKIPPNGRTD